MIYEINGILFEWDEAKNETNKAKHRVSFEQAAQIFSGPIFTVIDDREDYGEVREISIGASANFTLLLVSHTDRAGVCRIISARQATRKERARYGQEIRKTYGH